MKTFPSYSSQETVNFGTSLAKKILNARSRIPAHRGALVIALQGELGAGKTTFTQGFAGGLGVKRRMVSPTFIFMRRFKIPTKGFKDFYHIDAYRLKKVDGLEALGFKEIFADPRNIVLVEWPEKIKKILPKNAVWLKFRHGKKENERIVTMKG